jgi:hypothetical protein
VTIEVTRRCTVEYIEDFYTPDEADSILRALLAVKMTPEVIRMFGQDRITKRLSEQYGIDYPYNPAAKKSTERTPLSMTLQRIVAAASTTGILFSVFLAFSHAQVATPNVLGPLLALGVSTPSAPSAAAPVDGGQGTKSLSRPEELPRISRGEPA